MTHQVSCRLCVGDTVIVLQGVEKGNTGEILEIIKDPKQNKVKVIVDGVNEKLRHTKPTQENDGGGRVPKLMPVDISNVAFYLAKEKRGTKLGYKWIADKQSADKSKLKKVRYAKVTGDVIAPKVYTKSTDS